MIMGKIRILFDVAYKPTNPVSVQLHSYLSSPSVHVPLFKQGSDWNQYFFFYWYQNIIREKKEENKWMKPARY